METNLSNLNELFHLEEQDIRSYSPLTLAYIGDGVYELIIRTIDQGAEPHDIAGQCETVDLRHHQGGAVLGVLGAQAFGDGCDDLARQQVPDQPGGHPGRHTITRSRRSGTTGPCRRAGAG